jgi:hypothetical protein
MGRFYTLALALLLGFTIVGRVTAQQPLILAFPDTPCDSTACSQINVDGGRTESSVRVAYLFRDAENFSLDAANVGADTIPPGAPIRVPICFRPTRRGQITDSLSVIVESGSRLDTFHVRLTGRGIGPELEPDPFVLNFPRTNPGSTSTLQVTIDNVGELPYTFDAAAITLAPPFQLGTPGPIVIPPGGSITIDILFAPSANGVYSSEAELHAGCSRRLQLGLNGATDLIGTGAVIRLSKVRFNPVNEEETACSVIQCSPLTISNAGNAALYIDSIDWAIDTAGFRITNPPTLPVLIPANGQLTLEVCLESRGRGLLVDTLVVRSNSRTSIAFGMVLDLSGSMDSLMSCGAGFNPSRISQAIEQGKRFIGRTLLHLPAVNVQDHLSIMRYSWPTEIRTIFPLQPITDATRAQAQSTLDGLDPSGATHTGRALMRMMDTLVRGPLTNRVIVLLSDGDANDLDSFPSAMLVDRANALGIRIFTIGIGTDRNLRARRYLQDLSAANGQYFDGNDCGTLQQAFESITDLVSRGQIAREPFAIKVTSPFVISSGDLRFDSTYYLTTSCRMLTLTNIGEGDAVIDSLQLRDALGATTDEFSFGPQVTFPLRIPESGQTQVEICFTPTGLRERGGTTAFTYNSCATIEVTSKLTGTGWARAGMRIDDRRVGLPGTIATMPVHLDSSLAAFDVHTITFQVRWNKSMLDLRALRPLAAAGTGSVVMAGPIRYEGREAIVDFIARGDFQVPAGPLAELEFLVLRGDSLASDITISSLLFEDNNPKPLMKNAGIIAFDSTCFRDNKPLAIETSPTKLARIDAAPIPTRSGTGLVVTLGADGATTARLSLYAISGERVFGPIDAAVELDDLQIPLPIDGLGAGAYYLVVEDASGATHVRSVVVAE